jgi:acyl-CoA synthetase (AMP-forming)/AMP-acid ligase II
MIFDKATEDPDGLALDDLSRQRTWAELEDRSTRIARFLREDLGLTPEDHTAVLMDNRLEFVELILGAVLAGVWITPINRHLQIEEIAYIVDDSGSAILFTDAAHEAAARQSTGGRIILVGEELEEALARASGRPMPTDGPPGGTMIYTSGITGRPKGVKRARQRSVGEALRAWGQAGTALGFDGSGPHLVTGPLHHAAPLLFAIYDQMNGSPVTIMPRWDDRQVLQLIQERHIRHTHMVPTMFVRLLRLPEAIRSGFDPSSLRVVLHGAAPIGPSIKRQMIDWWGEVLIEYWGATEGGACTLVDSADWLAHPGTVGKPLPNFEVFAVDDQGNRLPAGAIGTLYSRHKRLTEVFEYHRAPEKTAESYLEPGVFTAGDVGHVDEEGYVYLTDRKSNMIVSGGVNIYPVEVEQVLQQHPAVADVGVFGIPDEEWGESVKAAVELVEGYEASPELESEILRFGREHLAGYKVPRSIDFEDRLPRHLTGKLYIRSLRDRYWKDRKRNI